MSFTPNVVLALEEALGRNAVLADPFDLALYEFDGGVDKARPDAVVFPQSTADVVAIVKIARYYAIPLVGRGAGTGLSGGAIPRAGGIVVSFSRMNRILEIDVENERAIVEPGVVNQDISAAVDAFGYFFAPDPSSQKACTIGGNVAENAGGPHTLAHGVTTNHVVSLEVVLPDATVMQFGGSGTRRTWLRHGGLVDRFRRHHGAGNENWRAADAEAGSRTDHAGGLQNSAASRRHCGCAYRKGHCACGARDDGWTHAAHGGRCHPCRLS